MKYPTCHRRRGAAIVVALVALVVAGVVSAGMLRLAVARHRQLQAFERRAQAQWLLDSGLQRARIRLADPDYTGESWEPMPQQAVVTIRVETIADRPTQRRLHATARLTTGAAEVQRSRQVDVNLPKPGEQR